ncbi:MAG: HEPN-associated N-terminal domain-containing protein [Nitrospirota bacterium]
MQKFCCVDCFDIEEIKEFIRDNNQTGQCDYCNSTTIPIREVSEVGEFVMDGFNRCYEDAANSVGYCSEEGGYLLDTDEIEEILNFKEEIFSAKLDDPTNLLHDLVEIDTTPYVRKCPYSMGEDKISTWEDFCTRVKFRERYTVFMLRRETSIEQQNHENFLSEVLKDLFEYCKTTLYPGQDIFRARLIASQFELCNEELTSPPSNKAKNSRMSPAGISVFYGALEENTAISEIQPSIIDKVAIGHFKVKIPLKIINLSSIPKPIHIFNENYDFHFEEFVRPFIGKFIKDISKPIRKTDTEIEYLPTQVFTEFIRNASNYKFDFSCKGVDYVDYKVDGILYPSSLRQGGCCIVLFNGPEISLRSEKSGISGWLIFQQAKKVEITNSTLSYNTVGE